MELTELTLDAPLDDALFAPLRQLGWNWAAAAFRLGPACVRVFA